MAFLLLNLYHHSSGLAFDPAKVIERVKEAFPEAAILPGDQAEAEVKRAETLLAGKLRAEGPDGPASKIVASLRRKASAYGPSFAFTLPLSAHGEVQGLVRSVGVQFLYPQPLPPEVRQRLIDFLKSLEVGSLEEAKDDVGPGEVLMDLSGPCSWMRSAPGAPWQFPAPPSSVSDANHP